MILQGESGLGAEDYAALRDATGDASLEVELQQYSLGLTLHDMDGPSCLDTFDAIVCGDTIVRAGYTAADTLTVQSLATEDGGDENWSVVANLAATGISSTLAVSLATDGVNTVRVFYYDAAAEQIEYFENAAKGVGNAATWGATALCIADTSVVALAATTLTRVHYLSTSGTHGNRRFWVVIFNGSWTATGSELYWQLPVDSFDAVVGPQTDDGAAPVNDVLAIATDFPHIIGRKIDNGELIYTITQVQGIAVFRYQNGRWSDHYGFDIVDEAPSFPSRHDLRLSSSGDLLFMTYYREDGTSAYSHTSIATSRSKDGIHWELPYLLPDVLGDANILLKRGNHAYLLNSWKCYRSPSVGYTGDPQNNQDITDYVTTRTMTSGDAKRLELTLANPEQVLDALGLFNTDMSLQVKLKDGYWVGEDELLVQTMLGDVDVLGGDERLPTDQMMIEARDVLSRMTLVRADQVNEWESQRITGDNFDQASDSVYSGMRHTAVLEGHWKTESNELYIVPKEAACLATNTGVPDAYNGSCQSGLRVAATDSDDYAGLVFRCYDKRNYMNVRYVAEEDRIVLHYVQDMVENWIVKSDAMGWTYDTWYYLKVRFRYGYAWVYSSTDGTTWIEQISGAMPCVADGTAWSWTNFAAFDIPNLSGKMGYVAHGYSDETDTYIPPPPIIPPPPPFGGTFHDTGRRMFSCNEGVIVTDEIGDAAPVWYKVNTGLGAQAECKYCWKILRAPWEWWTTGGVEKTLWGIFGAPQWNHPDSPRFLYKMEDFPNGTWTRMYDAYDQAEGPDGWEHMVFDFAGSIEVEGLWYALVGSHLWGVGASTLHCMRSLDDGEIWQQMGTLLTATTYPCIGFPNWYWVKRAVIGLAHHSGGEEIFVYHQTSEGRCRVRRSVTSGATWTVCTVPNVTDGRVLRCTVPYNAVDWGDTDVVIGQRANTYPHSAEMQRSIDSGGAWANRGKGGDKLSYVEVAPTGREDIFLVTADPWAIAYLSDNAGGTWPQWNPGGTMVYTMSINAVMVNWNDAGGVDSILVHDKFYNRIMEITPSGESNKTGNLGSIVTLGSLDVTWFERDTLGTA